MSHYMARWPWKGKNPPLRLSLNLAPSTEATWTIILAINNPQIVGWHMWWSVLKSYQYNTAENSVLWYVYAYKDYFLLPCRTLDRLDKRLSVGCYDRRLRSDTIFCPNKQIYDGSLDFRDCVTITEKAIFSPLEIPIWLVSFKELGEKVEVMGGF